MRTLIIERHEWETGSTQRQLQFVLETARKFFGSGNRDRSITVNFYAAPGATPITKEIVISHEYGNKTRRTNGFPEMGGVPSSFVFFQETGAPNTYNVWWQVDKAVVAAKYHGWIQGHNTQFGRGRLSKIVDGPVPRIIDRCD